ncbi:MAG TPA: hypothetical protein VHE35_10675 [Kofleriaceae bacterium]|nr:hypothetical protein [Kofleriaceae bacterium]
MRPVCTLLGLALAVGLGLGLAARGAAADRPAVPRAGEGEAAGAPPGDGAVGVDVAIGGVRANGLDDGWMVRAELEAAMLSPPGGLGGYGGYLVGIQGWKAGADGGVGLPVAVELGLRAPRVRLGGLLGFEAIFVDRVGGDRGLGLYAPLAGANVRIEIAPGWSLGADARVTRRWQLGADDHTQWQLGFSLTQLWERRLERPYL